MISLRSFWIATIVAAVTIPGPDGVSQSRQPLAIVNVTVVSMTHDGVDPGRTVVIQDGRIAAIAPAASASLPQGGSTIEGSGRYLMPGLVDMHVHLQPTDRRDVNRRMLDLFLANGVARVRNMIGSRYVLELRDSVARGRIRGPTIVTAGPVVDGPASQWGNSAVLVRTREDAERTIVDQQSAGYDFVKIYSRLRRDAYFALLDAAHRHGIKVAGHVPVTVPIADALAAGQASIEHLLGYLDAIESDTSPVRGKQGWQARMAAFDHVDDARLPIVAAATARASVWNCPTLVAMTKWVPPGDARRLLSGDEMQFAPAGIREHWLPWTGFRLQDFDAPDFKQVERARDVYRRLVRALHQAGAGILVGTDTPSPFVVPGFSVHEELQNLVDAGFTPFDALRAATADPARYLGRDSDFGVVVPGASADLLLLDSNPLTDVAHARDIAGIIVRGEWIPRLELDAMIR